ncbi:MAG: AraC family transcriptional regulator, partial [Acidobacteriota bacterium]
ATLQRPFYSVSLAVDLAAVHGLLLEMEADLAPSPRWDGSPPLRVSPLDAELAGALARFLRATRAEMDRQILAPAVLREVLYLLLQRDQGDLLHLAAAQSRHGRGVAKALHLLDRDYARRLDVPTLAREVGMSISSLHHRFKEATALTPIQYLKHVRLQKARALLVDENLEAAEAAHRVGYASPSQFSREFKKVFGSPPKRYALQQRAARA